MVDKLSSCELIANVEELLRRERRIVVAFLKHLGEIDRRRLHLEMGFGSLFTFCTDRLKLSTGTAWRRVTAVQLLTRHPVIAEYLLDNRLTLAALGELREVLGGEDALQLLDRAAGRTQLQVRELVASIRPRDAKREVVARVGAQLDLLAAAPVPAAAPAPPQVAPVPAAPAPPQVAVSQPEVAAPPPEVRGTLYRLHLTVERTLIDKLEQAKDLFSHTIRDRDTVRVIEACLDVAIKKQLARRGLVDKPRACKPAKGRRPNAAQARAVWATDGGSCGYVAPDGTRCNSTVRLQVHHVEAVAKGGATEAPNLSLRCEAHNQHHADTDFGRAFMDEKRRGTST